MRFTAIAALLAATACAAPIQSRAATSFTELVTDTQQALATLETVQSDAAAPSPGPALGALFDIVTGVIATLTEDMVPVNPTGPPTAANMQTLETADSQVVSNLKSALGPSASSITLTQFQSAVAEGVAGFKSALASVGQ